MFWYWSAFDKTWEIFASHLWVYHFLKLYWLAQGGSSSIQSFRRASRTISQISMSEFLGEWYMSTLHLSIFRCRQIGPKRVLCLLFDFFHILITCHWSIFLKIGQEGQSMHDAFILLSICVLGSTSTFRAEFILATEEKSRKKNIYQPVIIIELL